MTDFSDIIYKEGDDYEYKNGLYYWYDEEHFGRIWLTKKMVDKYNLGEGLVETLEKAYVGDEKELEDARETYGGHYTHEIYLLHCSGVSTDNRYENTIDDKTHGDIRSEEFVAWWNDFPIELLKEDKKDVLVMGWADG